MSRRLIVWLLVSLAIHAGLAGATLAALRAAMLPPLFIDLIHGWLVSEEPSASGRAGRGAGASPPPATASAPARSRGVRAERLDFTAPPRSAPAPRESPAETAPATPPAPPPAVVPEAAPTVVETSPAPVPPPAPSASSTVESAAPRLAAPPIPLPSGGGDGASGAAPPSADGGSGQGQRAAGAGTSAAGRDSASDGAPGSGVGRRDGPALALAVPGGTGTGEATEYAGYYALLRRRVIESLTYPPLARRRNLGGTVHLELEIQPTGVISRVEVAASSSHRVLDDAAVDTVRNVGRVPFPPHVPPRLLRVRLPIVFDLR
jgi:periplasmic protein TonB